MAGTINKHIIIGNLGRDPEIRQTSNGSRLANLSVATSEQWTDRQSGERRERTEWHRVVIFDEKLVEVAEKYLKKGSKVYLEGQVQTRKFQDQQGEDRYMTETVLKQFQGQLQMLEKRGDNGGGYEQHNEGRPAGGSGGGQQSGQSGTSGGGDSLDDLDDEVPF